MLDFSIGFLERADADAGRLSRSMLAALSRHALARSFAKRDRDPTLEQCEGDDAGARDQVLQSRCGRPCADGRRQAELPTGQRRPGL